MDEELHAYLAGTNYDLGQVDAPPVAKGVMQTSSTPVLRTNVQAMGVRTMSLTSDTKTATAPTSTTSGATRAPVGTHRDPRPEAKVDEKPSGKVYIPEIIIGPPPEDAVPAAMSPAEKTENGFVTSGNPTGLEPNHPVSGKSGGAGVWLAGSALLLLVLMVSMEKGTR